MSEQVLTQVLLGVVILGLLIFRQLRTRPVRASSARLMAVLGVIGIYEAIQFFQQHHTGASTTVIAALAGSLGLAVVFGVIRAATVRVWLENGQAWMRGNVLTAILWVIALAAHLGYDYLLDSHKGTSGLGNATIVLYLAITLGVQRMIVAQRARKLTGGGPAAPFFSAGPGPVSGSGS